MLRRPDTVSDSTEAAPNEVEEIYRVLRRRNSETLQSRGQIRDLHQPIPVPLENQDNQVQEVYSNRTAPGESHEVCMLCHDPTGAAHSLSCPSCLHSFHNHCLEESTSSSLPWLTCPVCGISNFIRDPQGNIDSLERILLFAGPQPFSESSNVTTLTGNRQRNPATSRTINSTTDSHQFGSNLRYTQNGPQRSLRELYSSFLPGRGIYRYHGQGATITRDVSYNVLTSSRTSHYSIPPFEDDEPIMNDTEEQWVGHNDFDSDDNEENDTFVETTHYTGGSNNSNARSRLQLRSSFQRDRTYAGIGGTIPLMSGRIGRSSPLADAANVMTAQYSEFSNTEMARDVPSPFIQDSRPEILTDRPATPNFTAELQEEEVESWDLLEQAIMHQNDGANYNHVESHQDGISTNPSESLITGTITTLEDQLDREGHSLDSRSGFEQDLCSDGTASTSCPPLPELPMIKSEDDAELSLRFENSNESTAGEGYKISKKQKRPLRRVREECQENLESSISIDSSSSSSDSNSPQPTTMQRLLSSIRHSQPATFVSPHLGLSSSVSMTNLSIASSSNSGGSPGSPYSPVSLLSISHNGSPSSSSPVSPLSSRPSSPLTMCSKLYSSSQVGSSDIRPAPKTTPLVPIRLVNSEPGSPTNYYDNSVLFQSPADVNTPTSVEVNSDSVQGKGKWKEGSKPKPLANRSEGNHSNSQSTLGSEIEFNKPLTSGSYLSTNSIVQTANPINSTAMSPTTPSPQPRAAGLSSSSLPITTSHNNVEGSSRTHKNKMKKSNSNKTERHGKEDRIFPVISLNNHVISKKSAGRRKSKSRSQSITKELPGTIVSGEKTPEKDSNSPEECQNNCKHNKSKKSKAHHFLSKSDKTQIQSLVRNILRPMYRNGEVSKDEYTDINKRVSRIMYKHVTREMESNKSKSIKLKYNAEDQPDTEIQDTVNNSNRESKETSVITTATTTSVVDVLPNEGNSGKDGTKKKITIIPVKYTDQGMKKWSDLATKYVQMECRKRKTQGDNLVVSESTPSNHLEISSE